ncbi:hypothetical protein LWI28_024605 [Acer negundo]|uniref:Uncharacterized protein n=1 Tax=Acer negundo TaxID=4023 RepID=A0AAD5NW38_ACENE|nr:hypothetical protein LWI28_024605 [Acer negundo]
MQSLALNIQSCTKDLGSWNEVNIKELRAEISRKHEELKLATSMIQTGSFHSRASARRSRNVIKYLFDSKGLWKKEDGDVSEIITQYFKDMFCYSVLFSTDMKRVFDCIQLLVSLERAAFLRKKRSSSPTPTAHPDLYVTVDATEEAIRSNSFEFSCLCSSEEEDDEEDGGQQS